MPQKAPHPCRDLLRDGSKAATLESSWEKDQQKRGLQIDKQKWGVKSAGALAGKTPASMAQQLH